jgi:GTP-binding protein
LDKAAVNYQIVLTKSDEVPPSDLASLVAETQARLAEHPAAFPQLVSTSARTGSGIVELRAAIARLLNEREHGGARAIGPMDG